MTKTFRDLGVDAVLCDRLADSGITHPFPIQELTLPLALDGHDLIGQARTGTGKTLAFGLPLLQRLDPTSRRTQALVIVPTRELCLQVHADLQVGTARDLTTISVYGGVGYDEQIEALTGGVHVVVGTPGRLLDLLNRGVLDLSAVTQLVLDEADEMLDMGFLPDVERLVEACTGQDRHTMLFSATMPTAIVKLARRYMDHPTFTRADHAQKNTAPLVTQYFFQVHRMDKPRLLARILQSKDRGGVYVFVRTKHMADRLVNDLEELHVPSIAIHGDLRQSTREKNLDRFRAGKATVLVCTEVAARGLDVSGVTHVVNYDCPDDEKMYLHRIGRTARAGEAGVAITFAEFNEIDRLNVIRKAVGATDSGVEQVFSTSKQLQEMFDLPDERPWDHLSTKGGGGRSERGDGADRRGRPDTGRSTERGDDRGGRGTGGRGGGGRRDEARREGRGRDGRTDGRSKNTRSSEGRGGEHDATRKDRPASGDEAGSDDAGARESRPERSSGTRSSAPAASEDTSGTRTRTRTRTRGRSDTDRSERHETAGPGDRSAEGDRAQPDEATTRSSDRDDTSTSAPGSSPRPRARARARGGRDQDASGNRGEGRDASVGTSVGDSASGGDSASAGDSASSDRADANRPSGDRPRSGGGRSRGGRRRGGRSGADRATGSRSDETGAADTGAGDAGGRSDDRGSGDTRSSDAPAGEGRSGSGGERSGGGRGRSSRGSRGGRGGKGRGRGTERSGEGSGRSGARGGDATVRVADRGEDARGDGQPQPARRVKVEHLP